MIFQGWIIGRIISNIEKIVNLFNYGSNEQSDFFTWLIKRSSAQIIQNDMPRKLEKKL